MTEVHRPDDELPVNLLDDASEVSEESIERAIEQWKRNPPDEKWKETMEVEHE